jgi:ferredoxin
VDCIHEVAQMLVIDPVECIDCGACVPECPVEAIFSVEELPPEWTPYESINAAWADGPSAVDHALESHLEQRG